MSDRKISENPFDKPPKEIVAMEASFISNADQNVGNNISQIYPSREMNISQIDKSELNNTTINPSTANKKRSLHVSKSKLKLPNDFHQRVIEAENKFILSKTLEIVEELLHLYKVKSKNLFSVELNITADLIFY
jgi:hypothetical protein